MKTRRVHSALPETPRDAGGEVLSGIPGFRLIEQCGRGGSGSVYLGIDRDGVRRAVRIVHPVANRPGIPARESSAVALYRNLAHGHPHLIDILYSGHVGSTVYYILPLADSASVRQYRYRPLTLAERLLRGDCTAAEKLRIVRDVADAVAFLHEHGVAHRDLKPENILFVDGVLKVADPGLLAPISCISTGGTREFSPPHPCSGIRTDLYALGKIMYCVFTGFPAENFPKLPPDWKSGFHARLNWMILKCCAAPGRPGYRSAAELAADLAALELPQPRWHALRRAWRSARRSAELWLVLMALLFGLISCRHTENGNSQPLRAGVSFGNAEHPAPGKSRSVSP